MHALFHKDLRGAAQRRGSEEVAPLRQHRRRPRLLEGADVGRDQQHRVEMVGVQVSFLSFFF